MTDSKRWVDRLASQIYRFLTLSSYFPFSTTGMTDWLHLLACCHASLHRLGTVTGFTIGYSSWVLA